MASDTSGVDSSHNGAMPISRHARASRGRRLRSKKPSSASNNGPVGGRTKAFSTVLRCSNHVNNEGSPLCTRIDLTYCIVGRDPNHGSLTQLSVMCNLSVWFIAEDSKRND